MDAENAEAFLRQLDDIKIVDTSDDRLDKFKSEDEFNALSVELLVEVGSYVCVAGNLLSAKNRSWNRNEAIIGGHLVRLYKLISGLLDQICQRRHEMSFVIARLIFECIVNLRFLIKHSNDPAIFDSYIAYSLKQEKRLYERIEKNIASRSGVILPVESRMMSSIERAVSASGTTIEKLSSSRPKEWADKNLYQRAEAVGLQEVYLGTFGGPSASVHGNWMDILGMHLTFDEQLGGFTPNFKWAYPRPQIADTTAMLVIQVLKDYFEYLSDAENELLNKPLDNLFDRIEQTMKSHEQFLIRVDAS